MEPIKQNVVTVDTYADWNNHISTNRFVAFLDIMGFKDTVARRTHDEVYIMLNEIYLMTESKPLQNVGDMLYITMFSDSIVIFSKDDSFDAFIKIVLLTNIFMSNCIHKRIPLKGGMAHGRISVDIKKKIFFGQPLIDAYQLEEDVCYYGVVAHNSIDRYLDRHSALKIAEAYLFMDKTILKCGQINHLNSSWFHFNRDNNARAIKRMYSDVSGAPRRYIDNTLEMFEKYKVCAKDEAKEKAVKAARKTATDNAK